MFKTKSTLRVFESTLLLLVLTFGLLGLNPRQVEASTAADAGNDVVGSVESTETGDFKGLQFTSAGHVLSFNDDGVVIASIDHLQKTVFVDANCVEPRSSAEGSGQDFSRVSYDVLWKGVDLIYTTSPGTILKSTYYIAPEDIGGSVARIRIQYNRPVSLDKGGNLVTAFETGSMTESRPIAWQEVNGQKRSVTVNYRLYADNQVGFTVEDYLSGKTLVIDPSIIWSTFLGGSKADACNSITVDGSGNIYVAGTSGGSWTGVPVHPFGGGSNDAFVAKLGSDGARVWYTYLGGNLFDWGNGLALDGSGNIYITGTSMASWGETIKLPYTHGFDAFVAKLNNNGVLQWNTFLGSNSDDEGRGIAVDASGNVYVTGYSCSSWGTGPVNEYGTGGYSNAFVAKLDTNGALIWHTFQGDNADATGYAIALGNSNNIYVVGAGAGNWGDNIVHSYSGSSIDIFAAELSSNGVLGWNTFWGDTGVDVPWGTTVDGSGNIYVAGYSTATWGNPKRTFGGGIEDAFAFKLNSSGGLQWNTFLGGSGDDSGFGITVDSSNVYVAGYSDVTWGSPTPIHAGDKDAFAACLDSDGEFSWNAFVGGNTGDVGNGIDIDSSGNLYLAGYSAATWGSPKTGFGGGTTDGLVVKLTNPSRGGNGGPAGGRGSTVGGSFSPVDRLVLVIPLTVLVLAAVGGGGLLILRRRKGT
jgi:hypothetical protein